MQFTLSLPDWAITENQNLPAALPTLEDRMAAVIRFSRLNFENGTGGPFAAGIFERDTGKPVVIGVNRVMPMNCSSAHAEVMTLSLAQQILGHMGFGWAGTADLPVRRQLAALRDVLRRNHLVRVRSLAIAGSGPELESITGFDEGPIHPAWDKELEKRGVEVIDNVLTAEAVAVFQAFAASDSVVYNARQGE